MTVLYTVSQPLRHVGQDPGTVMVGFSVQQAGHGAVVVARIMQSGSTQAISGQIRATGWTIVEVGQPMTSTGQTTALTEDRLLRE